MDEYLGYLNSMKNVRNDNGEYSSRRSYNSNPREGSNYRKKRYNREFKDLDDPEQNAGSNVQSAGGVGKLISYDDL